MIKPCLAALLLAGLPAASSTMDLSVDTMARLHEKRWESVEPAEVKHMFRVRFRERADEFPPSAGIAPRCKPSLYLTAGDESTEAITLEFEPVLTGTRCRQTLYAIAAEVHTSHNAAQQYRTDVLNALRPGGKGGRAVASSEFEWRSLDSRTKFSLSVELVPAQQDPQPDTATDVKVILKHEPCVPAEVDDLPFPKGVMFPHLRHP